MILIDIKNQYSSFTKSIQYDLFKLNGFFALSDIALISSNAARLEQKSSLTEKELRMIVKVAKSEGVISGKEAEIHHYLFRFFDRKAEQIMTRRNEIT